MTYFLHFQTLPHPWSIVLPHPWSIVRTTNYDLILTKRNIFEYTSLCSSKIVHVLLTNNWFWFQMYHIYSNILLFIPFLPFKIHTMPILVWLVCATIDKKLRDFNFSYKYIAYTTWISLQNECRYISEEISWPLAFNYSWQWPTYVIHNLTFVSNFTKA